jgi:hypothetical protein
MAIKTFKFNYDCHEAEAVFRVDTDVFTNEILEECKKKEYNISKLRRSYHGKN